MYVVGNVLTGVSYYSPHFLNFPLQPNARRMAETAVEQDERLVKVTL